MLRDRWLLMKTHWLPAAIQTIPRDVFEGIDRLEKLLKNRKQAEKTPEMFNYR